MADAPSRAAASALRARRRFIERVARPALRWPGDGRARPASEFLDAGRIAARNAPHVAIVDIDLADGAPELPTVDPSGVPWTSVQLLVRLFEEPIGLFHIELHPSTATQVADYLACALRSEIAERLRAVGIQWDGSIPRDGFRPRSRPPFLLGRDAVLADAPALTVAVCTRNRAGGLRRLLESLRAQSYPNLRTLVVDNAPNDDATRRLVESVSEEMDIRYALEPKVGLSRARNRSIEAADTDLIAWVDDDEACDPQWATEVVRGFLEHPGASAVSGIILAAEVETPAQEYFEHYGGHHKGRGFTVEEFSPRTRRRQSPMYPLPPFGTGGNMAFRRASIEEINGFDCALGAGTLTKGAEDTAAFSTVLLRGGTVVYQPSAIVWHWHRREYDDLRRLFHGYGRGLGAFYTSMLLHHPSSAVEVARILPAAVRSYLSPSGPRLTGVSEDFPRELLRTNLAGWLLGPALYGWTRLRQGRSADVEAV